MFLAHVTSNNTNVFRSTIFYAQEVVQHVQELTVEYVLAAITCRQYK